MEKSPQSKVLYPLDEFYQRAGLVVPSVQQVDGPDVPEPYRSLLVHDRDMTPTLEAFHGERIHLKVIGRRVDGDDLSRLVVLTTNDRFKPVEFGAIVIHTANFPAEAREIILECRCPLGTILADFAIPHYSRPQAFFRLVTDPLIRGALETTGTQPLYGRRNLLAGPGDKPLAEVLEILPPVDLS